MIGLKSYLPILARHLNTSEAVLYERQRKLTNAGLLVGTAGRGPGSGIRISAPNVALVIMGMMVTDDLADVGARTDMLASQPSDMKRCPLTSASTFGSALALVLQSESAAATVQEIEVLRSSLQAQIVFRQGRRLRPEFSGFGREASVRHTGLQSKYWLPGADVLAIAQELAAIVAGKRPTLPQ